MEKEKIVENSAPRISSKFQTRLLEIIDDKNYKRTELASLIGISKDTISKATLYGVIPKVKSLIKIANFLNVSFNYLLAETDDEYFYPSENPTTFHIRLKELTVEKQTKFSQIAHKMPFSRNLFQEWLRRGTLPSVDNLLSLSKYFQVSPDYLLGRTDDR